MHFHLVLQCIVFLLMWIKCIYCKNVSLSIIHFNDFHARYQPVNNISASCEGPNCIGGFSRLYSVIKQLKNDDPNSLLLNAGDNFQGSLWHIVYKWNATQHFLNKLPLDAITIGNHEFDDGIEGLIPFLSRLHIPVIVSNIDDHLEPRFQNLYHKSIVIERNGKRIGLIGALTQSTKLTSYTENLILLDESLSVNLESEKLNQQGTFTNIVLSHCGYEADLEIARKSSHISCIVGGHTDTFLYSGSPIPGPDKPSGPYPTVVLNKLGEKVLAVQASAYTKYLGNITIVYDDLGNVVDWKGAPIFLDSKIKPDPAIEAEIKEWQKEVDVQGNRIIGQTALSMLNKPCREQECLLGNFATDAMLYHYKNLTKGAPSLALMHAGGMRAGIENGNITFNQLITTFPFQDTINICRIKGKHVVEILESAVNDNRLRWPHLIQVSGITVIFNTTKPEGDRVQSLKLCHDSCIDFDLEEDYQVFAPKFLTDSNFVPLFKKYTKSKVIGDRDSDIYIEYLKMKSPLSQQIERRITFVQ